MSEEKFNVDDMALEGDEKSEKFNMELESPAPSEIEARIKELLPHKDIIEIEADFKLVKMASGNYVLNYKTPLEDLTPEDLNKIDKYLK